MINFKFNEKKTTQAALLFLDKSGGGMNYMKLIKLLYLTDRHALVHWERPITGDFYVSMKHGPVLSNVLNIITYGKFPGEESYWYKYIETPEKYEIKLKCELPELDELNKREMALIDELFEKFKDFDQWEMVEICHEILPEWKDVTWEPIDIDDILRIENIADSEIKRIQEEIDNLNYVKEVLAIND